MPTIVNSHIDCNITVPPPVWLGSALRHCYHAVHTCISLSSVTVQYIVELHHACCVHPAPCEPSSAPPTAPFMGRTKQRQSTSWSFPNPKVVCIVLTKSEQRSHRGSRKIHLVQQNVNWCDQATQQPAVVDL